MNTKSLITSLDIFWQLIRRDIIVSAKHIYGDCINYLFCYPLLAAINFGFLQPNIFFKHTDSRIATIYYAGSILLTLLIITYKKTTPLMFDLEQSRYVNFELTLLNGHLVILKYILVATLHTFLLALPFFLVGKFFLGPYIDTSTVNISLLMLILLLSSLMCSAYHQFVTLLINASQLSTMWARFNTPLLLFGGMWGPWGILLTVKKEIAYLCLLNPLTYVSEGIRAALVYGGATLPLPLILTGLFGMSTIFLIGCLIAFKRRVDHI